MSQHHRLDPAPRPRLRATFRSTRSLRTGIRPMSALRFLSFALLAALALAGARPAAAQSVAPDASPVPVADLVHAVPFRTAEPIVHVWRAEQPAYKAGWILVLRVAEADREILRPRQTLERVLYVGDQTARRVNVGYGSRHLVVIVPSDVRPDGSLALDPRTAPIWFGGGALPEQVDAGLVARERARAEAAGAVPVEADVLEAARRKGGAAVEAAGEEGLVGFAMNLVERYAPDERDLVRGFRQAQELARQLEREAVREADGG